MKYVFILVLLIVAACRRPHGRAWSATAGSNNMTQTARIMPGERELPDARGRGAARRQRSSSQGAARARDQDAESREDATRVRGGRQGALRRRSARPATAPRRKGGVTGPVATKFIPPPDLTNAELQQAAHRRLLAQLHHGGRRRHAGLRRGDVVRRRRGTS